ncbi:MAG: ribose 5-phosphate isomerase B [Acidobacteriota bacterium]
MKIAIGSDHAGFDLKSDLIKFLAGLGGEVQDLGTYSREPADYPDFAEAVALAVAGGEVDRGIMICGSGVGASVAANKVPGVRAAVCHDPYSGHQGVEHDDMNVLVLGSRIIGTALAHEIVQAYLGASFSSETRHLRRLGKVLELEQKFPRRMKKKEDEP